MTTTVANIRGISPEEWLADPNHVYIGRRNFLRSGKYTGQLWAPSLFANPIVLPRNGTRTDRLRCLELYVKWLASPAQEQARRGISSLRGKILGCWCGVWDGNTKPTGLLCHGVVLAVLADHYKQPMREQTAAEAWVREGEGAVHCGRTGKRRDGRGVAGRS